MNPWRQTPTGSQKQKRIYCCLANLQTHFCLYVRKFHLVAKVIKRDDTMFSISNPDNVLPHFCKTSL